MVLSRLHTDEEHEKASIGTLLPVLKTEEIFEKLELETALHYPGANFRPNSRNFVIFELDQWAHPDKQTTEWEEQARAEMSEVEFRREHKRDWTSAAGKSYMPEFARNKEHFIREAKGLINAPVIRGWDFGFGGGFACIWMQYSEKDDRVVILRELYQPGINTDEFGMLVRYFSGQAPLDMLRDYRRSWEFIQEYQDISAKRPELYPPGPWFTPSYENPQIFYDFSGPEATNVRPIETESGDRTDQEILKSVGIYISIHGTRIEARDRIWRRMMRDGPDGKPLLWVSRCCRILLKGLGGGLVFKKPTPNDPHPEKYLKDGLTDHVFEAASYAIIEVVPSVDQKRRKTMDPEITRVPYHDISPRRRQGIISRRRQRRRR